MTTVAERQAAPSLSTWERVRGWVTNPWGRPRFLVLVTWGYMIWAIVPVLIAIQFSFNASRSRTTWAGFSTRWYWGDPVDSVWNDPGLRHSLEQSLKLAGADVLIATPIGVLLARLHVRAHGHARADPRSRDVLDLLRRRDRPRAPLLDRTPVRGGSGRPRCLADLRAHARAPAAPRPGDRRERGHCLRHFHRRLRD